MTMKGVSLVELVLFWGGTTLLLVLSSTSAFIVGPDKGVIAAPTTTKSGLLGPSLLSMHDDQAGEVETLTNVNRRWRKALPNCFTAGMIATCAVFGGGNLCSSLPSVGITPPIASAAESLIVGELKGSGLVFKDTLEIESFEDPKVKGVTLYISNFQRPLTERLQKDFFTDPSSAAVACAKTGPIQIASNIVKGKEGEEVFKESKSLLFKSLRVQRIYDEGRNTIVYVSFNTRLDKNDDSNKSRFKSSLCAVNLDEYGQSSAAEASTAAPALAPAVAP